MVFKDARGDRLNVAQAQITNFLKTAETVLLMVQLNMLFLKIRPQVSASGNNFSLMKDRQQQENALHVLTGHSRPLINYEIY